MISPDACPNPQGADVNKTVGPDDRCEKSPSVSTSYRTFGSDPASGALPWNPLSTRASSSRRRVRCWVFAILSVAALLSYVSLHISLAGQGWLRTLEDHTAHGTSIERIIQVKQLDGRYAPTPHAPKDKDGKRLVIVGDVHGYLLELQHLLKKVDFDRRRDHLILTGDMIDKGPDSHGVLALARELDASCVRGNHEDKLLKSHFSPKRFPPSKKLKALGNSLSKADYDYLLGCPLILSIGDIPSLKTVNAAVVHAGLLPRVKLSDQPPFVVMHMRTMSKHHKPSDEHDGEPWWEVWQREQKILPRRDRLTVIYGHDSKMGLVEQQYSFGLDSGCARGRKLTALVLGGGKHERELVSVACAHRW